MKTRDIILQIYDTLNISNSQGAIIGVSNEDKEDVILKITEALNRVIALSPELSIFSEVCKISPGAFHDGPNGFYSVCPVSGVSTKRLLSITSAQYIYSGNSVQQPANCRITSCQEIYTAPACTGVRYFPTMIALDYTNQLLLSYPLFLQGGVAQLVLWCKTQTDNIEVFIDSEMEEVKPTTKKIAKTRYRKLSKSIRATPVPDYYIFMPDTIATPMDESYRTYLVYKSCILAADWLCVPQNPEWESRAASVQATLMNSIIRESNRQLTTKPTASRIDPNIATAAMLGGAPLMKLIYGG